MAELGTNVDRYLESVWQAGGTDLLLTVGAPPMARIDGQLRPIGAEAPIDEARARALVDEVLDQRQQASLDEDLDVLVGRLAPGDARLPTCARRLWASERKVLLDGRLEPVRIWSLEDCPDP